MAAPAVYLTIVKRFTYRGNAQEEWSNSYALSGATPADSPAWRTLFDALVAEEKKLYLAESSVVSGYGYDSIPVKGDSAIWSVDLTVTPNSPVVGVLPASAGAKMAGDQASWVRWGLDRFNTKGKRVFLRKYFHNGLIQGAIPDSLYPAYTTALDAFGLKLRDGTFTGGRRISDKDGTTIVGHAVSPYSTTRTLKRRGKRPPT